MVRKMLILKMIGALALLGATAGGIAAGVANGPVVSSKAMETQSAATETPSASSEAENPGTDLRNTKIWPRQAFGVENRIWDSMSSEKKMTEVIRVQPDQKESDLWKVLLFDSNSKKTD